MARAIGLSKRAAVNKRESAGRGGVKLPYTPPEFIGPPPGTYDPGLEAQVRSSERGLLDLIEQEARSGKRETQDTRQARRLLQRKIDQGRADLRRQRGYDIDDAGDAREQLSTSFKRDLEDLAVAQQRGEEDYRKALVGLQHKYATAAQRQGEASLRQGTAESGTDAASGAVRGANVAFDTAEVDAVRQRQVEDLARREGRLREDFGTSEEELGEGLDRQLDAYGIQGRRMGQEGRTQFNALKLAALRAGQDRATKISHAKREQGIYSTDVAGQAFYQAHQMNPKIVFPTPAAAAGPRPGRIRQPSIGAGLPAPDLRAQPPRTQAVGRAVSRRPYTRY